jgi:hypothetical protein
MTVVNKTALLALCVAAVSCNSHRRQGEGTLGEGTQHVGEECEQASHCVDDATCFEGTCVGDGLLRVSLAWDRRTDLDLHVLTPSGHEIYWEHKQHPTGQLDVDDCVDNNCRKWEGPHVENVFFTDVAEEGEYTVWVENYDGRRSSDWWIEVVGPDDLHHEWQGSLPSDIGVTSDVSKFEFAE